MTPSELSGQILNILEKSILDDQLDLNTLRIIAIGPSRFYHTLNVYVKHNWDEYPYFESDESIGSIALDEWLNDLDSCSLQYTDTTYDAVYNKKKASLRQNVIDAMRLLAVETKLVTPGGRIALMELDFLGEDCHFITAFCHPCGNGEVLPLMERRPPTKLIYPYGVLHEEGLSLFYPEGIDVEGTSFDKGAPGFQEFLFNDIETVSEGDRGISLIRKNDAYSISFKSGVTRDEHGFPNGEEIEKRLVAHFANHDFYFEQTNCPDPSDKKPFQHWMEKYIQSKNDYGSSVIEKGSKKYGAKAMQAFIDAQPASSPDRMRSIAQYASCLANEGLYEAALSVEKSVKGKDKAWLYDVIPMALLRLDRCKEAVDTAQKQLSEAEGQWKEKNARGTLALALSYAGDLKQAEKEARQLINDDKNHKRGYYCLAHSLYKTDVSAATDALKKALLSGSFNYEEAELDFQNMPELIEEIQNRKFLYECRTTYGQVIKDKLSQTKIPHYKYKEKLEQPYWEKTTTHEFDEGVGAPHSIKYLHDQSYVSVVWNKGLRFLELDKNGNFKLQNTISETHNNFAVKDSIIYTAHSQLGLCVYGSQPKPKLLAESGKLFDHNPEHIFVHENIAGIGDSYGIDLYDISQPDQPEFLSTIGVGRDRSDINASAQDFLIHDYYVYIANNAVGLVIVDISNPRKPDIVSAMQGIKLNDETFMANKVAIFSNTIFLYDNSILWLVDVSDPSTPVSLGTLKVKSGNVPPWIDNAGRFMIPAREGTMLAFEKNENCAVYTGTILFEKPPPRYDYIVATNNGFIGIEGDEYFIAKSANNVTPVWDEYKKIPPLKNKLLAWVQEGFQHFIDASIDYEQPDDETNPSMFPVGVIVLETLYNRLSITIDGQRSRSELSKGSICNNPLEFETTLEELFGKDVCPEQIDGYDSDLSPVLIKERNGLLLNTWINLFKEVFAELKQQNLFAPFQSGRIFLGVRVYEENISIIDTYINDNYPWIPYRHKTCEFKISDIKELLDSYRGYKHIDRLVNMAVNREDVRGELYRLAIDGLRFALICTRDLADGDTEGVKAAFLAAAKRGVRDITLIRYFQNNMSIPQAEDILKAIYSLCDKDHCEEKLVCAVALNKLETDEMVAYIKEMLSQDNATWNQLACIALQKMASRINEFQDVLLDAIKDNSGWDLPLLAKQLMRTGYSQIPEALVNEAKGEKQYENVDSMGLDFDDDDKNSAKDIEREWSANIFLKHLETYQDPETPLWPASLHPEANYQGWRYWMDKAGSKLQDNELIQKMVDVLTSHVDTKGEWPHDRAMLRGVISWLLEVGKQIPPAAKLANAMVNTGEKVFDKNDVKYAKRVLEYELANRAWGHVKNQEYIEARVITDTLLTYDPYNGEFLFLDGRLVWLMESIDACLEKIEESLQLPGVVHSPVPRQGRAKLLNLKGCAFDELKRWQEALEAFKAAVSEDPESSIYQANLAELHDKLANNEEAIRWATSARKLGSDSEVVNKILDTE